MDNRTALIAVSLFVEHHVLNPSTRNFKARDPPFFIADKIKLAHVPDVAGESFLAHRPHFRGVMTDMIRYEGVVLHYEGIARLKLGTEVSAGILSEVD